MRDRGFIAASLAAITLFFIGLPISRAMLSISFGLLVLIALLNFKKLNRTGFPIEWLYVALLLLLFGGLDYFRSSVMVEYGKDMEMLGMFVLGLFAVKSMTEVWQHNWFKHIQAGFYIWVSGINLVSVLNYIQNREAIDALLLQSKHIPIAGNMHHIYFGLLNAVLVLFAICKWLEQEHRSKDLIERATFWAAWVIFICLHVLSSRTGLFAFYLVLIALIVFSFLFRQDLRIKIKWLAIPLVLMPLISFLFMPSFQNKIQNTTDDFQATRTGGDEVNFKSMGMRLEAWKTSWHILEDHWLLGVGSGQVEQAMKSQYEKDDSKLFLENRIGPHNQFLEYGIKFGITGPLILLLAFVFSFLRLFRVRNITGLSLLLLLFFSMLLESTLERQQGVSLVLLIFIFCLSDNSEHLTIDRNLNNQ